MVRYAYVVDLTRCMGCEACVIACKVENNTPQGIDWMYVFRFEEGEYPNVRISFMPRPCMHCDNPPCAKVCPVGARFKREDGFVLTDYERCIGCRYCQVACPYGVNYFNWKLPSKNYYLPWEGLAPPYKNPDLEKKYGKDKRLVAGGGHRIGVIEKCTWCVHRVEKGLKPACVANCPTQALLFGDLDDPNSEVSKALSQKPHFRLLEDRGTSPRVFYLGPLPYSEKSRRSKR
jgi:molybdopterin-containing oxidoreductase family iron-sulfur binding subunit